MVNDKVLNMIQSKLPVILYYIEVCFTIDVVHRVPENSDLSFTISLVPTQNFDYYTLLNSEELNNALDYKSYQLQFHDIVALNKVLNKWNLTHQYDNGKLTTSYFSVLNSPTFTSVSDSKLYVEEFINAYTQVSIDKDVDSMFES